MQSSATARKLTAEGWLEPPPLPHHYDTLENHQSALRFGMWLFLGTEVLLFAGIFVGYFVFRSYFPESFEQAARHLSVPLGTANTLLLLTSSLTVALAHHNAEHGKNRNAFWLIMASVAMGAGFLCIKAVEY
ncbi:MAG: cytochrome c oxidase subunit 3, partial [Myxococcaceae bacterium]